MGRLRARHRCTADRGQVVLITAFAMVALLIVAALVVDLGFARELRRRLQLEADLAAVAAGYYLAGNGGTLGDIDPRLACGAAISSLRTNVAELQETLDLTPGCNALPSSIEACDPDQTPTVVASTTGPYAVRITYPVPNADIARMEYRDGIGLQDGAVCQRMQVQIETTRPSFFSGILGDEERTVGASAVVRGALDDDASGIPALLVLERRACGTLSVSGQGGIHVYSTGTQPAIIHSDTAEFRPGAAGESGESACTMDSPNSSSNWSIYGTSRPAAAGGGPSIIADGTVAHSGRISTYALHPANPYRRWANGAGVYDPGCNWVLDTGSCADSGLSSRPMSGRIISRDVGDEFYNPPAGDGIDDLHARAYGLTTMTSAPPGWGSITGSACNNQGSDRVYQDAAHGGFDRWLVRCSSFGASNVVFRGSTIVFTGRVDTPQGSCGGSGADAPCDGYLAFPNASEVFVRGCGGSCTGSNSSALSGRGLLAVNTGEVAAGVFDARASLNAGQAPPTWPALDCGNRRRGRGAGGTVTSMAQVATLGGDLAIQNGTASLCNTTVYVGANRSSYQRVADTTSFNCTEELPCPALGASADATAFVSIDTNANPPVSWTAPNVLGAELRGPGQLTEDLALWTESSGTCTIKGQGALRSEGIWFMPNCTVSYAGQADNQNPINAQFVCRTLDVAGQGVLALRPAIQDAIAIPLDGQVMLIR